MTRRVLRDRGIPDRALFHVSGLSHGESGGGRREGELVVRSLTEENVDLVVFPAQDWMKTNRTVLGGAHRRAKGKSWWETQKSGETVLWETYRGTFRGIGWIGACTKEGEVSRIVVTVLYINTRIQTPKTDRDDLAIGVLSSTEQTKWRYRGRTLKDLVSSTSYLWIFYLLVRLLTYITSNKLWDVKIRWQEMEPTGNSRWLLKISYDYKSCVGFGKFSFR